MAVWEMTVTGRVQGVGFRWFVKRAALDMGVKGYVRNLPDSTVRILAQADVPQLECFVEQIRLGSRHSMVAGVNVIPLDHTSDYYDFEIR